MQLVLVSGLSGSGKTIALRVLEDGGYYCVDNLPANLLMETVDFLAESGNDRAAVSIDARSAALPALPDRIDELKRRGVDVRVLYLEASSSALLRRFSETRRRHPLAGEGLTLAEAIDKERALLAGIADLGSRIDTSELQPRVLQNWIRDQLGIGTGAMTLLFESFSFKDGLPLDADWVLDCRMLPNPHYDPQLRPFTGRDAPVIDYLKRDAQVRRYADDVEALLKRWLPEIARENRSHVTVALGCTGGRHRSVYLAEELAKRFGTDWRVLVRHRKLSQESPS
ncbi:MAG TPA: RNase adapter RapZ [Burkholderiales bacterium]|jgi:RNase adapter protein RapZ|nr:RNase adapter RapZ [Burkholderiales bacterium]